MTATTAGQNAVGQTQRAKLPLAGLLALFTAGFLGILNETIPAGLLPQMAKGLGVSESAAGQSITIYALATALTAIPLNALLRNWGRRTVLVLALLTFVAANAVSAFTDSFVLLLVVRFVAGVGAGLIWSNLGGYAARLVAPHLQGKAITIAMAGTPIALALGLPAGTILAGVAGWHATFGAVAAVGTLLVVWAFVALPNVKDQVDGDHVPFRTILRTPGVAVILWVGAGFMIAHNIVYTYIGPLAIAAGIGDLIQWVLLVFGVAALVSIWLTGTFVDPHHRRLILMSTAVLGTGALILGFATFSPVLLYVGAAVWGFGFGGSATLFVTAGMRAAGTNAVQSLLVTVFNISIALGGIIGGLLLAGFGATIIPWVAVAIMIPTSVVTLQGRRHAFPRWPARL
jgi:predicted MFS family arabinose efflux permease